MRLLALFICLVHYRTLAELEVKAPKDKMWYFLVFLLCLLSTSSNGSRDLIWRIKFLSKSATDLG